MCSPPSAISRGTAPRLTSDAPIPTIDPMKTSVLKWYGGFLAASLVMASVGSVAAGPLVPTCGDGDKDGKDDTSALCGGDKDGKDDTSALCGGDKDGKDDTSALSV